MNVTGELTSSGGLCAVWGPSNTSTFVVNGLVHVRETYSFTTLTVTFPGTPAPTFRFPWKNEPPLLSGKLK